MAESLPDPLAAALRDLTSAIDLLEAAAERQGRAEARRADLEEELAVTQEDRLRLAADLEGALAYAARLGTVCEDVEHRLREAAGSVELGLPPSDGAARSATAN